MTMLFSRARFVISAFALLGLVALTAPAVTPVLAQQPTSVNPTASAVSEDQLLQQLKQVQGRSSLPDVKSQMLQHPAGRDWRHFHEVTLRWVGAIAILGVLALLVIFYLTRGMVRLESGRSGRKVVRFNAFERAVHWMTATCFILLALSGLNVTFGKPLLLPLLGPEDFSAWSEWAKYGHNYLSFPFTSGVVLIFVMWIAGNIPTGRDVEWVKRGGGIVGNDHPPADRFNAGQKSIFWLQVIGGGIMVVTGYILMFPFYGTDLNGVMIAQMVHGVTAMVFIAIMLGHIYIGSIGMEGAFEGMGEGTVDVNWARQHHSLWLAKKQATAGAKETHASPQPGHPAATAAE
jgi:formate dehydrogenase subunit gamma